jgi:hypothetical protein
MSSCSARTCGQQSTIGKTFSLQTPLAIIVTFNNFAYGSKNQLFVSCNAGDVFELKRRVMVRHSFRLKRDLPS